MTTESVSQSVLFGWSCHGSSHSFIHSFIYSVFQSCNKMDIEHVIKIAVGTIKNDSW